MLGAGVSLGGTGVVAPGVAIPTVLPAIPVLGAVPGVPGVADWAWPLVGVGRRRGVGLVAAAPERAGMACPACGRAPWPAWRPASAGWLLSWLSTGDLGVDRLVGLGPRFPDLLLWATLPLAARRRPLRGRPRPVALAAGTGGGGRAHWIG